jgi:hypothetical protein
MPSPATARTADASPLVQPPFTVEFDSFVGEYGIAHDHEGQRCIFARFYDDVVEGETVDGREAAEFLAKAGNAYDAMREALKAAQRYFHDASLCPPEGHRGQCAKITAALAAAEGDKT